MISAAKRKSRKTNRSGAETSKVLDQRIERRQAVITAVALGVHLLLCLVMFDPKLHTGGDNAAYMLLAESILRLGDGYSMNMNPGLPSPQTLYPFGYPLLLTLPMLIFGKNVIVFKALSALFSLGSVLVFSLIVRRLVAPLIWCALIFAIALNPVLVEYSHWILTESPFLFFSLLAIYLLIRSEEEPGRAGVFFWAAVATVAFTCLIRSAGITLVAAALSYFLFNRKWLRLAMLVAGLCLMLAPWNMRNWMVQQEQEESYSSMIFMKNPYSPHLGMIDAGGLLERVKNNSKIYFLDQSARGLFVTPSTHAPGVGVKTVAFVISLLTLAGLLIRTVRKRGVVEFFVLATLGLALIWPEVWSDIRFIMPVVPFFLFYIAESAVAVATKAGMRDHVTPKIALAVVTLFAAGSLLTQLPAVRTNLRYLARYAAGDHYAGYGINFRQLFESADWVSANTPEDAVVTVRKPRLFHYLSGRKVMNYPYSQDADSVLAVVMRTDYVVIDGVSGTTGRYLVPALQKRMESFKLVYNEQYAKVVEVLK